MHQRADAQLTVEHPLILDAVVVHRPHARTRYAA